MNRLVLLFAAAALALLPCAAQAQHTVTVYQPAGELVGHTGIINDFAFSPDGKLIATASDDSTVRVWDVQGRKEVERYSTDYLGTWKDPDSGMEYLYVLYQGPAINVAFQLDGKFLLFTAFNRRTGAASLEELNVIFLKGENVNKAFGWSAVENMPAFQNIIFRPNSAVSEVMKVYQNSNIGFWLAGSNTKQTFYLHDDRGWPIYDPMVHTPVWSPDGNSIIGIRSDRLVLIDISRGYAIRQEIQICPNCYPSAIAISPDGKQVAIGDGDGSLRLLNLETREIIVLYSGNIEYPVGYLAFSPDGSILAVGDRYGDVWLWDIVARQEIAQLTNYENFATSIISIRFSPDGKFFAALFDRDKTVRLWQVQVTAVEEENTAVVPQRFFLRQNYPNPFNPETIISYELPQATDVRLAVYDLSGRQVRALVQSRKPAGFYRISWDGRDDKGREAASGVYFYRLTTGTFTATRKMVIMK